jgi:tetratricopeptide (TPR) repeat protein
MRTLTLLFVIFALVPRADARRAAPSPNAPTETAATVVPVASPATVAVTEGLRKLAANDLESAMADFQRAIAADLASPEGHYYLGVAQRRADRVDRALESFRNALTRADAANDVTFGARARIALAMTFERMDGHADDIRAAWVEVQTFAGAHPGAQGAEIARTRLAAIDAYRELSRTYEPVRHRIAERARHGQHGQHGAHRAH